MNPEIKRTLDGSDTLFVPELNEHYHSTFGAVQESMHVFIKTGLMAVDPGVDPVHVFEVGFGTGLNALLTDLAAKTHRRKISYSSIELHPLESTILKKLNYVSFLPEADTGAEFDRIHDAPWEVPFQANPYFRITKLKRDLRSYEPSDQLYDIVYFDAFAPDVQPELWTVPVFEKLFRMLRQKGLLVTYSCKGQVKRDLREAGFFIEKIPGPPGKREILRAHKK
ncbi:MAG: tRNA (5-methylaminomethyl-2-thiouridine)(34)-methyltransferase MnmD [Bacteroidales bacterium]|nr:tRNA (5-methylaminomethyl-2-thiouridine)(34)-methyltransferase MnmD [Bacteroidales bacterium]